MQNKKLKFTVNIEMLTDGKTYFLRTREIAVACGIKQPFEFTSFLKKISKKAVIKGKASEKFRDKNADNSKSTFIKLSDALVIMRNNEKYLSHIGANFYKVLRELEKFAGGYINEKGQIVFKEDFV